MRTTSGLLRKAWLAAGLALALVAAPAAAQEKSSNKVATRTDWHVFVEKDPLMCWIVSAPKKTVNTRGGRVVSVKRGDIMLFVSFRPAEKVMGEVSFTGGYPFKEGSTVKLQIGEASFELFTKGEWAWTASPEDDRKVITAMKRGAEAVAIGVSKRGTTTKDTFSLIGFTAAFEEAEKRCSG